MFPGDDIDPGNLKPRNGVHRCADGKLTSQYFGVIQKGEEYIDIVPFNGSYFPRRGDKVIGKIMEVGPSMWTVDIKSPYMTMLHMNDTPWRTISGDLKKFLTTGDYVYAKVMNVNEIKESWITLKEPGIGLRKLEGGHIMAIPAPKVPRIIGKNGSMVNMVKDATFTRIVIGQNGLIWIDGLPENVIVASEAIALIESEAHATGLTDRITEFLKSKKGEINGNTQ
ncbi:exosome complex RNA-binding protein Rrp4 [Cuniculiplasma divulgatum]|uniref:Exosome complex component Rrp4 n=1 Tax=Cuniculiplasma divulgatum TaxID=1673428 RepID=A0A1N5SVJ8_9ARCH|nr:exosome complex RNA-binding protein Rrp4 [Cuniculiplasma divulgatum]MCI2412365.1 exosome complex RNA-binding protein Rrp4 [Cuniculiplasma sp.]MCL4319962.1 exosome complex RNA-binding protein Rrp4 [Candidatus Thermoplasmatota archaeon]SIM39835.1 exosome complex RNA-binding protein Rrp4 [Cuniculiplasma divulgatum]